MRITMTGELVFQPGDDFFAEWTAHFDEEPEGEIARFLEESDGVWGCEIMDNNDHTAQAHDFTTKESLVAWLSQNKITIED
jgi:hypothetical protein